MEQLTVTILYGILIGVLVSCPMGPVGVLCVRRTLQNGRRAGMLTGIGAAISDLLYAAVTYLGVGFVFDFIETNRNGIELFGSIVLILFGIFLYFTAPRYIPPGTDNSQGKTTRIVASSFLITISNPLIVFFYLVLFSRFSIVMESNLPAVQFVVTMLSIAIGALAWWTLITYGIHRIRNHVSLSGFRIFNHTIAFLFALVGFVGIIRVMV